LIASNGALICEFTLTYNKEKERKMKRNYTFVCIFLLANALGTALKPSNTNYPVFDLPHEDITWALQQSQTFHVPELQNCPPDIVFACADIKYSDNRLAFCETGDGVYMSLRGADIEFNNKLHWLVSPGWGIFWNYLAQLKKPVWLVEWQGPHNALAIEELSRLGGYYARSLKALAHDHAFKVATKKNKKVRSLNDCAGIIIYRANSEKARDGQEFRDFRAAHPEFIYVSVRARKHIVKKDTLATLCSRANLEQFYPKFKIYPSYYDQNLTAAIKQDFKGIQNFIIKPVYSSLSMGVNMVDTKGLDSLLSLIHGDKKRITSRSRGLYYWHVCSPSTFMVAEHVPSKTMYKDGKPYDPTMRVMFIMQHDQGVIKVNVLGGFWKIPVKPLNDKKASLTEKHVTIAHAGDYYSFGMALDSKDRVSIKKILEPVLAGLYKTMLQEAQE
jgi:hypothetical protein